MYLFSNKEIDVREYTNSSVATPRKHLREAADTHPSFNFNGARLSIAIARTLASHHPTVKEFWLDIFMSAIGIRNIVSRDSREFKLIEDRLVRLRDFTRTSRIGEMAQGIAYLFSQDRLGYPIVGDFEHFFNSKGVVILASESTPDFVLQKNLISKNISLLESKGTEINSTTSIKSFLSTGLAQCKNGIKLASDAGFVVENKFATCAEFSVDTEIETSKLHYVDPSENSTQTDFDDSLLRFHFASWFYLIRDFESVRLLIEGKPIKNNNRYLEPHTYNGEEYLILTGRYFRRVIERFETKAFIDEYFYYRYALDHLYRDEIKIGISTKIFNHLAGKERLSEFPNFNIQKGEKDNMNVFLDGTIFSLKQ